MESICPSGNVKTNVSALPMSWDTYLQKSLVVPENPVMNHANFDTKILVDGADLAQTYVYGMLQNLGRPSSGVDESALSYQDPADLAADVYSEEFWNRWKLGTVFRKMVETLQSKNRYGARPFQIYVLVPGVACVAMDTNEDHDMRFLYNQGHLIKVPSIALTVTHEDVTESQTQQEDNGKTLYSTSIKQYAKSHVYTDNSFLFLRMLQAFSPKAFLISNRTFLADSRLLKPVRLIPYSCIDAVIFFPVFPNKFTANVTNLDVVLKNDNEPSDPFPSSQDQQNALQLKLETDLLELLNDG